MPNKWLELPVKQHWILNVEIALLNKNALNAGAKQVLKMLVRIRIVKTSK